ncbi:MAG: S-methyl-5-thioribose-1-phosphate isomerase [Firmicutes bacterium]|nr:S-methyl-5-thioribose-1-phosphate isomerase [Bacillota bacterium]
MRALEWMGDRVRIIDQTKLPLEEVFLECRNWEAVAGAIREMKLRGAPLIGLAAAYGLALAAAEHESSGFDAGVLEYLDEVGRALKATRPTAVNLAWAVDRMLAAARRDPGTGAGEVVQDEGRFPTRGLSGGPARGLTRALIAEAGRIAGEDAAANRAIGAHGQELVPPRAAILTHCNAGALATSEFGTALGVIRAARDAGKEVRVYATEARPFLQGARLTAWELVRDGIPVTLITDSAAGIVIRSGRVDLVVVGADRIAANGDTANKVGTYNLAVLARANGIPFYVAAPRSTIDLSLAEGTLIPIEERPSPEVTHFSGRRVAAEGVEVFNPVFDVTPADLVTAVITDAGVARPPFRESLTGLQGGDAWR